MKDIKGTENKNAEDCNIYLKSAAQYDVAAELKEKRNYY